MIGVVYETFERRGDQQMIAYCSVSLSGWE
jgi:hypothetical protein